MEVRLGVKSDPIEYRYSYEWLFELVASEGLEFIQLGSTLDFFSLEEEYFVDLARSASSYGVRIASCFSSRRELGGWMTGDKRLELSSRRHWERYLQYAAWLGADYAGSNMGSVWRDRLDQKGPGIDRFIGHMKELLEIAHGLGLKGIVIEPMSAEAEPPSTRAEIDAIVTEFERYCNARPENTVPLRLCPDTSHGYVNADRQIVEDNLALFTHSLPFAAEFHLKNTDRHLHDTFGFSEAEQSRGIVDPAEVRRIILAHQDEISVDPLIGYLEINGPKRGRDYTDLQLGQMLRESIRALKAAFPGESAAGVVT